MNNSSNGVRPIPYVILLNQPSAFYRMRLKGDKRSTFLLSENASFSLSSSISTTTSTANNDPLPASSLSASSANKRSSILRKKNNTSISSDSLELIYPKIKIINGSGPATLIVSCVNKSEPYHVHPHRLVGTNCKSGVAVINIQKGENTFELTGVSIEYTKPGDVEESLNELKSKNVDPFNVGFDFDKSSIDLNQVRLCFQVYLRDSLESNEIIRDPYHILRPITSNVICNSSRKATLQILRTSANLSSACSGGAQIILFLKRIEKDQRDLHAKFYDENGWSTVFKILEHQIHYQNALIFSAPAYKTRELTEDVSVSFKLYVPFKDDEEREQFLNKSTNEDEEGAIIDDSLKETQPDGKYESQILSFTYKPGIVNPFKRKLDTVLFYNFEHVPEREAIEEISKQTRLKLAKRQIELIEQELNLTSQESTVAGCTTTTTTTTLKNLLDSSSNLNKDPMFLNFLMHYSNEMTRTNEQANSIYADYYMKNVDVQTLIEKQYLNKENELEQSNNEMSVEVNGEKAASDYKQGLISGSFENEIELNEEEEIDGKNQEEFEIESIINLISSDENFFSPLV